MRLGNYQSSIWRSYIRPIRFFSNTSLIKSKIDQLENYAKKNQLHKLRMDSLFEVFKLSETAEDYKLSLHLLNVYYNFGKNLNTQHDVNLFFLFILRTNQLNEAKDLLKYFNGWLLCPPSNKYILLLMETFFVQKKYDDVREIFSFVRQNSQIKLESSFYTITIKSMLMQKDYPLEEAMIIYEDSYNMCIYLSNEIHNLMLEHSLFYYHKVKKENEDINKEMDEDSSKEIDKTSSNEMDKNSSNEMNKELHKKIYDKTDLKFFEKNIPIIIIRLINELIKNRTSIRLSSRSVCLLAWANIYFDLKEINKKADYILTDVYECNNWIDILKLACMYHQMRHCNNAPFPICFKQALEEMKDDKDAIQALEYINIYFQT